MPIAQKAVQLFTKPIPRVISPRAHFALDYISAGVLLASTVALWPRNRRAALGAAICGVADLATATLTTRPGGARRPFSFRTHGRIDWGLATMTAMMPEFLGIEDSPQSRLFFTHSLVKTAVVGLTNFGANRSDQRQSLLRRQAA